MKNFLYMPSMYIEYSTLFVFVMLSLTMASLIVGLSFLVSEKKNDLEKLSAYECGFDPFGDSSHTFDMKFYIVAILFIIFDLEVIFLFPWAVTMNSYLGFYSMMIFLMMLTVGFMYEWRRGALDW